MLRQWIPVQPSKIMNAGIPEMLQKLQNDTKTIEKLQKTTKSIILQYKKHKKQ